MSIKKFLSSSQILFIVFLVWRLLLLIISFISPLFIPNWGNRFPYVEEQLISSGLPYWIWSWGNFDGVHYLTIAKSFYLAYYTQTFFPFYPLLIRILSRVFFENFLLTALLISNICFLASLYIFKKLIILDGYKNYLIWIILFLVFFPTSFFLGSIYTESLFLLLILSSFYFARRGRFFLSAFLATLSCATRLFGVLMVFSLLTEYLIQYKNKVKKIRPLLYIFLVPLGLIIYMIYLKLNFQDPFLFWHAQPAFGAGRLGSGLIFPPQVLFRYLKILLTVEPAILQFWIALLELLSFLFVIIILIIAHLKHIRLSYLVFSWLSLFLPTFTGTFSSLPRYIIIIFPIYIVLGTLRNKLLKVCLLLVSISLMLILATLFTRGYWVA